MIRYTIRIFMGMYLIISAGCSTLGKVVYHPDIIQGNYLVAKDIKKIHIGMNQKQVVDILGTPRIKDIFGKNIWYYICHIPLRHHPAHEQTLTLTFNHYGILIHIDNICVDHQYHEYHHEES
ncbi:Outer membrane protein assembly factor BamE [Candidatus Erwinia haradaeae]|uniref:Outer membrane protein assembly factor BamE n=1 Tax=Candidatus Erwinia haradaeae TaxID=1922217 RepID=A0A451DC43_9GAMM|nr:outer membrane protein assembly factor BamE [Candidatus Erwinia haradaeae]VFP83941.1 Outer membrane protein assembly factor BamE [Candidatus Erwinia haradaeae]